MRSLGRCANQGSSAPSRVESRATFFGFYINQTVPLAALPTNPASILITGATKAAARLKTQVQKRRDRSKCAFSSSTAACEAPITPPTGEYLPDARVPARGEVAVRLSREARVFVHHRCGRWDEGCFELGDQQKSEQQLGEASDGESELTWHNQTPHGVRVSNRALCQDSPRLQATGPGDETAEGGRVDGRHAEKAEIQTREAEVHHRVTPPKNEEEEGEELKLLSSSLSSPRRDWISDPARYFQVTAKSKCIKRQTRLAVAAFARTVGDMSKVSAHVGACVRANSLKRQRVC